MPGLWSDRMPHFRMGFVPSVGEDLQLQVGELRTVAADRLWMSPQYRQDTVCFHFTWKRDQAAVERVLVAVEAALAPFGARPHWGKLFLADAGLLGPLYPRLGDFTRLVDRLHPRGAFRNPWLERRVLGGA